MKVRELLTILQDLHPDDEVGLRSYSKRNMKFLGVDKEASAEFGHLVLTVDFTIGDKPVESARDILQRQGEEIKKAIAKLDKEELRAAVVKKRHKSKKERTDVQRLLDGYIPNGKSLKRIVTEEELMAKEESRLRGRGRPRKEVPPPPVEEPVEEPTPEPVPEVVEEVVQETEPDVLAEMVPETDEENSQEFSQLDNLLGL